MSYIWVIIKKIFMTYTEIKQILYSSGYRHTVENPYEFKFDRVVCNIYKQGIKLSYKEKVILIRKSDIDELLEDSIMQMEFIRDQDRAMHLFDIGFCKLLLDITNYKLN